MEVQERDCDCQDGAEGFGKKGYGVSCLNVCACVHAQGVCAQPSPSPPMSHSGARAAALWLTLSGEISVKEGQALMANR